MVIHPNAQSAIKKEPIFVPVEAHCPDAVPHEENQVPVPVEKQFPPSIFPVDILEQVAGKFDIDRAYYLECTKRDPAVLNCDADGFRHNLSDRDIQKIMDYYKTMEPMDAYLLGPRLPTFVLSNITGFDSSMATVLKLVCNHLRDMDDVEYNARLAKLNAEKAETVQSEILPAEPTNYTAMLRSVKPYLTPAKITHIPDELQNAFTVIPKAMIKRAWTGKQFEVYYKNAMALYRKG